LNYLPASLGSLPKPSRFWIASHLHPIEERSLPWNMSTAGDHRVGWGWLGYVAMEFMCAEGFGLICGFRQDVNHINEIFREIFSGMRQWWPAGQFC
jgi:hypothetical protein